MIKVSVIMPVLNEEKYLDVAINSWIKQSLLEKELICIDDGSTDDSINIIENYCKTYNNIILLRQYKQGAGAARNYGLKEAKGEYVCFLDADDFYIDEKALECLYNTAMKENVHVCAGLLQIITEQKSQKDNILRKQLQDGQKTRIKYKDFQFDYQYQCYIFKKELLESYHIKFPLYKRFQDPPFLVQSLYYAKDFVIIPVEFYGYRKGFKVIQYTEDKINDLFSGLLFDLKFAADHDLDDLLKLTVSRINCDYLEVLYRGLTFNNKGLLHLMIQADEILHNTGYSIDILDMLLYMKSVYKQFDYNNYIVLKKLCNLIPQNSRVVLYGAGNVGQQCYKYIIDSSYYELSGWIDQYKAGTKCFGQILCDIQEIQRMKYDYLLIAIENESVSNDVKTQLERIGVKSENIKQWNEA